MPLRLLPLALTVGGFHFFFFFAKNEILSRNFLSTCSKAGGRLAEQIVCSHNNVHRAHHVLHYYYIQHVTLQPVVTCFGFYRSLKHLGEVAEAY